MCTRALWHTSFYSKPLFSFNYGNYIILLGNGRQRQTPHIHHNGLWTQHIPAEQAATFQTEHMLRAQGIHYNAPAQKHRHLEWNRADYRRIDSTSFITAVITYCKYIDSPFIKYLHTCIPLYNISRYSFPVNLICIYYHHFSPLRSTFKMLN